MRIGFLCEHNPFDRNTVSGTPFYALKALMALADRGAIAELRVLGDHRPQSLPVKILKRIGRGMGFSEPQVRFKNSADLGEGLDWIIGLVSTGLINRLGSKLLASVAHVTDAPPPGFLRDFYKIALPVAG